MSMRSFVKSVLLWSFNIVGGFYLLRKFRKTPIVLFWHGVSKYPNNEIEGESFSVDLFEEQIKYLVKHYDVISMDEFYGRFMNGNFTNKEVVITFDDGYKNNLTVVAPILKRNGLPFTVFISTQNISEQKRFYISIPRLIIIGADLNYIDIPSMNYRKQLFSKKERIDCAHEIEYTIKYFPHEKAKLVADELIEFIGKDSFDKLCSKYLNGSLLTWDDVRKLIRDYDCTIGSHCIDHCICHKNQSLSTIKKQLVESKITIEEKCGISCNYFAYPNGDFTNESNIIVSENYKMGFSTIPATVYSDLININCVGRVGVPSDINEFKFFLARFSLFN